MLVVSIGWQFSVLLSQLHGRGLSRQRRDVVQRQRREALRELIARSGDGEIYVSREIEWVHRMWRFYAIEAGRLDLIARTTYFSEPPATAAPGSKLICPAGLRLDARRWPRQERGMTVVSVPSIDGTPRLRHPRADGGGNKGD